jgi:hypothetical protein
MEQRTYFEVCKGKSKAIPVTGVEAHTFVRRRGSQMTVRLSALAPVALYHSHQEDSKYSFLLEAESTPVPKCGGKDYVN